MTECVCPPGKPAPPTAADLLVVSGDLNLDPGNASLLTLADLASSVQPFVEDTTIFAMINYSGAWNGGLFTYRGNVLSDGSRFNVGSHQWEIDYNSSTGGDNFTSDYLPSSSFVTVMAVPEPATLVLVGIGTGLAALAAAAICRRGRSFCSQCLRWHSPTPYGVGLVPGTPRLTALGFHDRPARKARIRTLTALGFHAPCP